MNPDAPLPLENFIQAVQSQLDKAQSAMAVKARNLNLPMTFAIKDINIDLRAHVEFAQGEIRIRPAGANEPQASVFHIVFTAITRPMIEENAVAFAEDPEDQSIDDLDEDLTAEERRKLEWVGVRTVKQLRSMDREGGSREAGRITNLPVARLRKALQQASRPMVEQVMPVARPDDTAASIKNILRVRGRNLIPETGTPKVHIGGRPVSLLKSSATELLLAPSDDQWAGELAIETDTGLAGAMQFDLRPLQSSAMGSAGTANGNGNASQTNGSRDLMAEFSAQNRGGTIPAPQEPVS